MKTNKTIIRVDTFFYQKEALFSFLCKFSKFHDNTFAYWDEFAFTVEELSECDGILIFNNPSKKIKAKCYPEKVIAFMMEPGSSRDHAWMFENLQQYAKVYSPIRQSDNTVLSHGYLGWHLNQNWSTLNESGVPEKEHTLSCIASNLAKLEGQRLRSDFIRLLHKKIPGIHFYGKGIHFIADKTKGLLPYKYSLAIENTSIPNYFTEKINDCFLAYTVPIYFGCTNIDTYFPENSFIHINIHEADKAIRKIEEVIANDNWLSRLPAVIEARSLALNKYQPLAGAADIFRQIKGSDKKQDVLLKPITPTIKKKLSLWLRKVTNRMSLF